MEATGTATLNVLTFCILWYLHLRLVLGQNTHWRIGHKQICRQFQGYSNSSAYQTLRVHEKMDALLLTNTIARLSLLARPYNPPNDTPAGILFSLLPYPPTGLASPPICSMKQGAPTDICDAVYSRFGNNNFAIHSHLSSIGHGVFPMTSRAFNHSCIPNAVVKYNMAPNKGVTMTVVALRDILPGEEVRS